MASQIISQIINKPAISIKNETSGVDVAKGLKVARVAIHLGSNVMKHQMEDGSTLIDSRVIMPSTAEVQAFCPNENITNQVNVAMINREAFYSLTSKGITLKSMMVESFQMSQTPDVLSATPVVIKFKQVPDKSIMPAITKNSSDSSLIDRGMNLLAATKESASSLFGSIKGFF